MPDVALVAAAHDQAVPVVAIGAAVSAVFAFAGLLVKHVMGSQVQSAAQIKEWRELLAEEKVAHGLAAKRASDAETEVEKLIVRARECELRSDVLTRRAETGEERAERAEERVTMLTLQVAEMVRKMTEGTP